MAENVLTRTLRQVEQNLFMLRRRFQQVMQGRRGQQIAARALARLQTIPGSPVYPIRWKTARQRRAFFATGGFGRGIPTRRTGETARRWRAEFVATNEGGLLLLRNDSPAAPYVYGPHTQPFHLDTGWVQLDDVAEDFFRESQQAALEVWYGLDPLERLS